MKSRKLKAVLAAVSALAVLATAMTGFAATVSTTTTYNGTDGKVSVTAEVTGVNGEVTYLAKTADSAGVSGSGILYIDQKTSSDGSAKFEYKVDPDVIYNLETSVTLGTDGTEAITQPTDGLGLTATSNVTEGTYSITYNEVAYGNGDTKLTAVIKAIGNNEIASVTIGTELQEVGLASYDVPVTNGVPATVVVTTKSADTAPSVEGSVTRDNSASPYSATTIIKVTGDRTGYEVGVSYKGYTFPAAGTVNSEGYIAVKLTNGTAFAEADAIEAYCTPIANN